MAKMNGQGMEALAVRRTNMADADKVRYRVYRAENDFVAVIAESALMAVKVSGVDQPLRIVRDLPTEGVAIQAERMENGDSGQRVNLGMTKVAKETQFAMPRANANEAPSNFVPLKIRDLDQKRGRSTRMLSPDELETITAPACVPAAATVEPEPIIASEPAPMPEAAYIAEVELAQDEVANLLKE